MFVKVIVFFHGLSKVFQKKKNCEIVELNMCIISMHDFAACVEPGGRRPTPRGSDTHAADRKLTGTFERRGLAFFVYLHNLFHVRSRLCFRSRGKMHIIVFPIIFRCYHLHLLLKFTVVVDNGTTLHGVHTDTIVFTPRIPDQV